MKEKIIKYRSVGVIAGSLIFNLISSLLVYHPAGVVFNMTPLTVTEWICDIVSISGFFFGFLMLMFDANRDSKNKLKEALFEAKEELGNS